MGLDDIIKRMEEEAEEKIREIREEYKLKREKLEKTFNDQLQKIIEDNKTDAILNKNKIKEELLSKHRTELKLRLLAEKEKIVNTAFEESLKRIRNAPPNEYEEFFKNKLLALKNVSSGDFVIGKNDKDKLAGLFDGYVKSGNFRLTISDSIEHGFLLVTEKVVYDFTLENIINEVRLNIEDKVARMLFGG